MSTCASNNADIVCLCAYEGVIFVSRKSLSWCDALQAVAYLIELDKRENTQQKQTLDQTAQVARLFLLLSVKTCTHLSNNYLFTQSISVLAGVFVGASVSIQKLISRHLHLCLQKYALYITRPHVLLSLSANNDYYSNNGLRSWISKQSTIGWHPDLIIEFYFPKETCTFGIRWR